MANISSYQPPVYFGGTRKNGSDVFWIQTGSHFAFYSNFEECFSVLAKTNQVAQQQLQAPHFSEIPSKIAYKLLHPAEREELLNYRPFINEEFDTIDFGDTIYALCMTHPAENHLVNISARFFSSMQGRARYIETHLPNYLDRALLENYLEQIVVDLKYIPSSQYYLKYFRIIGTQAVNIFLSVDPNNRAIEVIKVRKWRPEIDRIPRAFHDKIDISQAIHSLKRNHEAHNLPRLTFKRFNYCKERLYLLAWSDRNNDNYICLYENPALREEVIRTRFLSRQSTQREYLYYLDLDLFDAKAKSIVQSNGFWPQMQLDHYWTCRIRVRSLDVIAVFTKNPSGNLRWIFARSRAELEREIQGRIKFTPSE